MNADIDQSCDQSQIVRFIKQKNKVQGLDLEEDSDSSLIEFLKGRLQKCAVCIESTRKPAARTHCGHDFCYQCVRGWLQLNSNCPSCRTRIRKLEILDVERRRLLKKGKGEREPRSKASKYARQWYCVDGRWYESIPLAVRRQKDAEEYYCYQCGEFQRESEMLICDHCQNNACHYDCDGLDSTPPEEIPWFCYECR